MTEHEQIDEIDSVDENEVDTLAQRCVSHVKHRFNMELDFHIDTLSILDFFIKDVIKQEAGGQEPPPGDTKRSHLVHLLAPSIGAYFGQVICKTFPCRWRFKSKDPKDWLIEFNHVPLRFSPVGAAAESIMEETIEFWDGSLATIASQSEALTERLAKAPPVLEEVFYSLTTRLEVIQIAEEWLQVRTQDNDSTALKNYTPADYDLMFDSN